MANLLELNEFIQYLNDQANICEVNGVWYGQPYVRGGQHLHLTPSNYQNVIHNREADSGGYPGGGTYEQAAKAYCKRLFDAGMTELFAYDCSGLGMWFLQNVKNFYGHDMNANNMMGHCDLYQNPPRRGWWVFMVNANGRATHVGYMIDDTHVIESAGRKTGVIIREWEKKQGWKKWGIPDIWRGVIPAPGDPLPGSTPTSDSQTTTSGLPVEVTSFLRIKVRGKARRSVNVRRGPSTDFPVLFVAHGGDSFPLLSVSPSTGWYKIETPKGDGYITNKTKYTDMEECKT